MKRFLVPSLLVACFLASSCYYDVESKLYPGECDTEGVTHSATVVPLMDTYCMPCHSSSQADGGVALETFEEVTESVDNGLLICSIKWDSGCSPMPKNASQMPACDILKIERWIADGALEN